MKVECPVCNVQGILTEATALEFCVIEASLTERDYMRNIASRWE